MAENFSASPLESGEFFDGGLEVVLAVGRVEFYKVVEETIVFGFGYVLIVLLDKISDMIIGVLHLSVI